MNDPDGQYCDQTDYLVVLIIRCDPQTHFAPLPYLLRMTYRYYLLLLMINGCVCGCWPQFSITVFIVVCVMVTRYARPTPRHCSQEGRLLYCYSLMTWPVTDTTRLFPGDRITDNSPDYSSRLITVVVWWTTFILTFPLPNATMTDGPRFCYCQLVVVWGVVNLPVLFSYEWPNAIIIPSGIVIIDYYWTRNDSPLVNPLLW